MSSRDSLDPKDKTYREDVIDEIIYRCFKQGIYWGSEKDGEFDQDHYPEKPIDRTQANQAIQEHIEGVLAEELKRICQDNWQKPIPEQYMLDRIKQLKDKGDSE